MKRTLLTLFGLVVLVGALFVWAIVKRGHRNTQAVYQSDHTRLLAECRALIAANQSMPRDESKCGAQRIQVFDKTDPLFSKRGAREIALLNPGYITVSDKEVMICLSALPRIYVIAFRTNVQEYGSDRITNGLWLSHDPARDRSRIKKGVE